MVKCAAGHIPVMDYIALLSYLLASIAIAYFALELVFTGIRGRLYGTVMALIRR